MRVQVLEEHAVMCGRLTYQDQGHAPMVVLRMVAVNMASAFVRVFVCDKCVQVLYIARM